MNDKFLRLNIASDLDPSSFGTYFSFRCLNPERVPGKFARLLLMSSGHKPREILKLWIESGINPASAGIPRPKVWKDSTNILGRFQDLSLLRWQKTRRHASLLQSKYYIPQVKVRQHWARISGLGILWIGN